MSPVKQAVKSPEDVQKSSPPQAGTVIRLKYEMCKNWKEKGTCKYNDRCLFAHGDHELTKTSTKQSASPESEKSKSVESQNAVDQKSKQEEFDFKTPTKMPLSNEIFFSGKSASTQDASALKIIDPE